MHSDSPKNFSLGIQCDLEEINYHREVRIKASMKVTKRLMLQGEREENSLENSPEKYTMQERRKK